MIEEFTIENWVSAGTVEAAHEQFGSTNLIGPTICVESKTLVEC